uniref:Uncharacterized protein n=1 Tax=Oryzias latipes TaxID=8090 RepID=A0A3P9K9M7_ORYLA
MKPTGQHQLQRAERKFVVPKPDPLRPLAWPRNSVHKSWMWENLIEQIFEGNEVAKEKQVTTLPTVMGASTHRLLRSLVQPSKPKEKTFDEIVTILKEHFEPKPKLVITFENNLTFTKAFEIALNMETVDREAHQQAFSKIPTVGSPLLCITSEPDRNDYNHPATCWPP